MEYLVFGILCAIIAALAMKVYLLHRGIIEIDRCLEDILSQDTNRQITLSSRDRSIRRLASRLNIRLGQLRKSQLKYTNGDRELKESITNISHDLRTPLTAISGYLELLEREYHSGEIRSCSEREIRSEDIRFCSEIESRSSKNQSCSENESRSSDTQSCSGNESRSSDTQSCSENESRSSEVLRCLEIIRNRTEHMKQLTEELFRYSLALSVPEEKPQILSLNRVLEECLLSFYEALRKKGITPLISMPEEQVMRTLDPAALSRVFQNVLSNAVKYSGGDLVVRLSEDGTVTCSNTAPNLNPLLAEQLFDRYFTVETVSSPDSGNSTGLGLSIARLLTERLGGEISAVCVQKPSDSTASQSHSTENRLELTIRFPA